MWHCKARVSQLWREALQWQRGVLRAGRWASQWEWRGMGSHLRCLSELSCQREMRALGRGFAAQSCCLHCWRWGGKVRACLELQGMPRAPQRWCHPWVARD